MEIIGYFKENNLENEDSILDYVVIYSNYRVDINNKKIEWFEGYNVKDAHFMIKDYASYSMNGHEITLEEYKEATKGWYTPNEYLVK